MITKQLLEKTDSFGVMVNGVVYDNEDGIKIWGNGDALVWVAVRGGAPDWAVYADTVSRASGRDETAIKYVSQYGIKLTKSEAMKLVVADEHAWDKYRK